MFIYTIVLGALAVTTFLFQLHAYSQFKEPETDAIELVFAT